MAPAKAQSEEREFTPALGRPGLTAHYDRTIRFWTREALWREMLVRRINPQPGDTILDVGCGTGSLAIHLKVRCPAARVVGIDPDPEALSIARGKADQAGVDVSLRRGFARDLGLLHPGGGAKVISTLMFHQVPVAEKVRGVAAMFTAACGGEIHVADYALQPGLFMRSLFRATVQRLDGKENTQPNADGILERLLTNGSGRAVTPWARIRTPSGAISLFHIPGPPISTPF